MKYFVVRKVKVEDKIYDYDYDYEAILIFNFKKWIFTITKILINGIN